MEFLQDLQEARMTRNSNNQKSLTYTDCCERLFLSVLILEALNNFSGFKSNVKSYASRTVRYPNYNQFRMSATDLYNFIYFVDGDEDALNKLKDPGAAKLARQKVSLPTMQLNGYLHNLAVGSNSGNNSEVIIKVEQACKINNAEYKQVRRAVLNLNKLSNEDKSTYLTKLLFAARAKLRSSDLIDDFEKFMAAGDLESNAVVDTEPTISVPDLTVSDKQFVNYRYLVGQKNLLLVKHVVQNAGKGIGIPANFIKGYIPIIQMINDIVRAGPSFIQQLKVLHQRAKKHLKD